MSRNRFEAGLARGSRYPVYRFHLPLERIFGTDMYHQPLMLRTGCMNLVCTVNQPLVQMVSIDMTHLPATTRIRYTHQAHKFCRRLAASRKWDILRMFHLSGAFTWDRTCQAHMSELSNFNRRPLYKGHKVYNCHPPPVLIRHRRRARSKTYLEGHAEKYQLPKMDCSSKGHRA